MTDFNTELGEYVFTIEHSAANNAVSDKLKIFNCIRIYPIRYGLFQKTSSKEDLVVSNPENKKKDYDGTGYYPTLSDKGYNVYPMPLREGFLYVSSKESDGLYEYYCFEGFVLLNFYTKSKKEPQHKVGNKTDFIPALTTDTLHFFFSPIQLTEKFLFEVFFNGDKIRLKREFNCKKWSQSDGKSLSDFRKRKLDPSEGWVCYPKNLFGYDDRFITNYNNKFKEVIANNDTEKETGRDVFFMVDDPFGIAEQLVYDLNSLHLDHEALVRSIRMGVDPVYIRKKLDDCAEKQSINDEDLMEPGADSEQMQQTQLVHLLAIYIYRFTLSESSPKHIKKAARSVDEERLKKVLAVTERKAMRNKIDNSRKILELFVNSGLFQDYCEIFDKAKEGGTDNQRELYCKMLVDIKSKMVEVYQCLSILPNIKDKHIDLEDTPYSDPCHETLENVFKGVGKAGSLLHKEIDLYDLGNDYNESTGVSVNINGLLILADTIINSWWRIALESKNIKVLVKILARDRDKQIFTVSKADAENYLKSIHRERFMKIESGGSGKWRIAVDNKRDFNKGILRVDTISAKPTKADKILKSISQNKSYRGIIGLLYLNSIGDVIDQYDKDIAKGICQSVELLSAFTVLQRQFIESGIEARKASEFLNKKMLLKGVQRQIQIFSGIGLYAGMIADGFDARKKYQQGDYDAMLFYGLATVSGLAGGSLVIFMSNSVAAGWVGIGCALLIIGCRYLGQHFSDTELEIFIKRTVFSSDFNGVGLKMNEPYLLASSLSDNLNRRLFAPGLPAYSDYSIQVEEFLFTQAMMPFFKLNVHYGYTQCIPGPEKVTAFHLSVECDLAQAGMNISEIELQAHYIIDRKIVRNKTIHLNADSATLNNYESSSKYVFNDWVKNEKLNKGVFYYQFSETKNLQPFLNNKEAYVLLLIRFSAEERPIPMSRPEKSGKIKENLWIAYRYKIIIDEVPNQGSSIFPILKYRDAKAILDIVRIQTENEAFKIED